MSNDFSEKKRQLKSIRQCPFKRGAIASKYNTPTNKDFVKTLFGMGCEKGGGPLARFLDRSLLAPELAHDFQPAFRPRMFQ